jgi:hypothetical protein
MRSPSSLVPFVFAGLRGLVGLLGLASLVGACQVKAGVNASANASESHAEQESSSSMMPRSAPSSTGAASSPVAAPAPAAMAPPPSACPLTCYVASGGDKIDVSEQELTSIRGGLEPVLGKMRSCTSPEAWRDRGSPTLHLRVSHDGTVGQVDVDPHHAYDHEGGCIEQAAKLGASGISLPGRSTVRCIERCQRDPGRRAKPTKK